MLILAAISIMMLLVDIAIASDTDLEGSTIVSALVYGGIAIMLVSAIEFFYRISIVPWTSRRSRTGGHDLSLRRGNLAHRFPRAVHRAATHRQRKPLFLNSDASLDSPPT